jgi:inhibitor of KinA sporulation pathway (predicted exonuclease)
MTAALDLLGLSLAGTHHRGIDDARNIAKIVQMTLPNAVAS